MSTVVEFETDEPDAAETEPQQRWVTFGMGDQIFGLDVMAVQEVLRMSPLAQVPGAPAVCLGVINLRGHIVPVLDFRRLLNLPDAPDTESTRLVIVDYLDEAVALRVDRVGEVFSAGLSAVDTTPNVGNTVCPDQVLGVVRRAEGILILLRAPSLLGAAASFF